MSSLRTLYSMLLHWFSQDCLVGEVNETASTEPHHVNFSNTSINRFCQLSMRTWPWIGADQRLQTVFMRSLAFASEDSVPVCRAMSSVRWTSLNSITVLQLCAEFAMAETTRAKSPTTEQQMLELAMATVSNCCACVEGRQILWRVNIPSTICEHIYETLEL